MKNTSYEDRYSYVFTPEYEIFEWDLGSTFNYAEMASLIAPRPFMVERGHDDGVAPDSWVASEFAKVRRMYDKLGLGDRTEIEFFNGPHTINGQGTFRFLDKWLRRRFPQAQQAFDLIREVNDPAEVQARLFAQPAASECTAGRAVPGVTVGANALQALA